jgi:hypothetical protein
MYSEQYLCVGSIAKKKSIIGVVAFFYYSIFSVSSLFRTQEALGL